MPRLLDRARRIEFAARITFAAILTAALGLGCVCTLPAAAQRGGGRGGSFGGGGGRPAMGGFHGGSFGGGVRGGFGGARLSPPAASSYRGYNPGVRPGPGIGRPGAANLYRLPGGASGLRGAGLPPRAGAFRPGLPNRGTGALRPGYGHSYGYGRGYGYGYGRGHGYGGYRNPYRYPYRGYGFPLFPYFGLGYPVYLPGFLGWDLNWDSLGWNDPGWETSAGYDSSYGTDYDPGYGAAGSPRASALAQPEYPESAEPGYTTGPPPAYDNEPQPAATGGEFSQPSPLLPSAAPRQPGAPPRERTTVLVFKDGRPPEQIRNYALTRTALLITDGSPREIPLDELNLPATEEANRQAGVPFRLP